MADSLCPIWNRNFFYCCYHNGFIDGVETAKSKYRIRYYSDNNYQYYVFNVNEYTLSCVIKLSRLLNDDQLDNLLLLVD